MYNIPYIVGEISAENIKCQPSHLPSDVFAGEPIGVTSISSCAVEFHFIAISLALSNAVFAVIYEEYEAVCEDTCIIHQTAKPHPTAEIIIPTTMSIANNLFRL